MTQMCDENGYKLYVPPLSLCGDNAAMIGAQGYYDYKFGKIADENLNAYATMPIDTPFACTEKDRKTF
jgi:N6-L-threonylcarbamoyladenine synthase